MTTQTRLIVILIVAGIFLAGSATAFDKFYVEPYCPVVGAEMGRFGEMLVRDCGWATFRTSK